LYISFWGSYWYNSGLRPENEEDDANGYENNHAHENIAAGTAPPTCCNFRLLKVIVAAAGSCILVILHNIV
jgi:hypothetical protein